MKYLYLLLIFVTYLSASQNPIQSSSGYVLNKNHKGVLLWEDIPFAQPPIGENRWKAPKEILDNEKNIYPKEDNFCVQRPSSLGGVDDEGVFTGNEDCLYLDIFAPKEKSSNLLPVMFWIHGGGNTSGLKDLYDFSKMVKKHKVVVVRINYRLGPFGWFTHPAIQELQNGIDKTSNFGTLDIIMALKWVNQNISNFGGDSENITIFGESAGGHNVLSLLVSKQANGLFHKAISMSGYTTSISSEDAYKPIYNSSTSNHSSFNILNKILEDAKEDFIQDKNNLQASRNILKNISTEEFFKHYANRASYEELPLLTSDGVVIPKIGLKKALSISDYVNKVPTIAGSNHDEVKLWLATAEYFVGLDYSVFGSILDIPKVVLKDEDAFEAFNYYRSSAWKIRGVDDPLYSLSKAGNKRLYSYRFDWDDHRRLIVGDFKKLIGAAHATEIPLLAGNTKLVGGYPLSDLIYPPSISKFYTSRNMMRFWTNFAYQGVPGSSTNSINWEVYDTASNKPSFLILDKKKNLRMSDNNFTFKSLTLELYEDKRVNELEKCVILLQMFTFVGDDLYDDNIQNYPGSCSREDSEEFLRDNASFIEF